MTKSAAAKAAPAPVKEDRQFVTALARGLDILRSFDESRTELGTMELAHITGLPQPTVWRLCHTLVKCGLLTPSSTSDKLRIGMPVLGLGYAALSMLGFDELVRQEMHRLAVDFDAAVSLATPDRLDMLIIQRARGNGMLLVNLHVGSRLPIATSSFGWGYIASRSEPERTTLFKRLAIAYGDDWPQLKKNIEEGIRKFDENKYVLNMGSYNREINAIAVPIVDEKGKETLVINCGAPAMVLSKEKMESEVAPRLLRLARTIRAVKATDMPNFR
jgi:DNA-binding IclR family transcriptional regulator